MGRGRWAIICERDSGERVKRVGGGMVRVPGVLGRVVERIRYICSLCWSVLLQMVGVESFLLLIMDARRCEELDSKSGVSSYTHADAPLHGQHVFGQCSYGFHKTRCLP